MGWGIPQKSYTHPALFFRCRFALAGGPHLLTAKFIAEADIARAAFPFVAFGVIILTRPVAASCRMVMMASPLV